MDSLETLKQEAQEALSYLLEYNNPKYGLNIRLNPPLLNLNQIRNSFQSTSYIQCSSNIILKSKRDKEALDLLNTVIQFNTNKFTSLHYSQLSDFMFITIPKDCNHNEPIIINNDIDKVTFSHIIILAEENSKITMF